MKMREALIRKAGLSQDSNINEQDVYFIVHQDGQPDKIISNANEINKVFKTDLSILRMTVHLKETPKLNIPNFNVTNTTAEK